MELNKLHSSNFTTPLLDMMEIEIKRGVRNALRMHKLLGNPVCEWRDGKVVWIQPEDIVIPDDPLPELPK
jgi:hypothetical protein